MPRLLTPRRAFAATLAASVVALAAAPAQNPMPPDKQAEVALTAGRKAYADGNLPAAAERFREVVAKFGNTPQANHARYGLGLCLVHGQPQDLPKAVEALTPPANDGGFPDRAKALYQLAACHRALGVAELAKPANNPAEAEQRKQAARPRFEQALNAFNTARDVAAGKKDEQLAGRARCDAAEMLLRLDRVKEARAATEPFAKDAALAKDPARPLGLYYHGLACFLDRDPNAAGRALNQLAPFADHPFGTHARYLVGRVLHLSGENAEASVHYDGVLADHDKARKDAAEALKQPDRFKANAFEKARLDALATGPAPEYVSAAAFHGACLHYEAGRFAEALPRFQAFAQQYPASPLGPDAQLRAGFCLVQMRQFDEAAKVLAPLPDKTPRLADQAMFWLGKAQLGVAAAADPNNPSDRDNKLKVAVETIRKAADRANQLQQSDPDAKTRRAEMLFEMGDAMQAAKQYKEAAQVYEGLWNDQSVLPARREELLQRLGAAAGAAGEFDRSNQRGEEFRRVFPQSVLTPAVLFRLAENSYARAVEAARKPNPNAEELRQRYTDAAGKYKEVAEKFPEFERASVARFGLGVCLAHLGDLDAAVKALDSIPAPDRTGELAVAAYLLADCLIRQAPATAEDALAENIIREKLTAAAGLLDGFVASNPKAAEAAAAMLKLGLCHKRLGATLADPNERNQTLARARETFEKMAQAYPQDPLVGQSVVERAKVKALAGDRGGAMNDLRQFAGNAQLQQSPAAPLAALHLATMYREENNPTEAAKVLADARQKYDDVLSKDPERADWRHLLKYHHAVAVFETNKPADARKLFEEVAQQATGRPVAAEAALRSGQSRVAEGKAVVQEGVQARNQAGNDQNKKTAAEQKVTQGRQAVADGTNQLFVRAEQLKASLPAAEARARMYYDAAWGWRWLAEEPVAKARDELRKQAGGQDVPRGKVPVQPDEERAFIAYKRLIEDFADAALAVDARFELAELRADRGDHDEAAKLLKEAIDKEPADRPVPPETLEKVRLRLGASLAAKGDHAGAAAQFEVVAGNDKSPHRAQALYRAGETLLAAGDHAKAVEKLALFRDRPEFHNVGGVSDRAMLRLGQALGAAKQWEPSRQTFEVMLQRFGAGSPFAAEARYGVAWALQNLSQYDPAVAAYQQVIAATTSEAAAKAQMGIGQCRLAQKRLPEAAAAFLAVTYTYDYPEVANAAALEAARAFADANQPADAERVLRKLLKDAPKGSDWSKAAAERLEKLTKKG